MIHYIEIDGSGMILSAGYTVNVSDLDQMPAIILSEENVPGMDGLQTRYWDVAGDTLRDRPALPEFSSPYDLTTLPAGTVVTVRNEADDVLEITDLTDILELVDAGTYRVSVDPPPPYQPIQIEYEVP